VTDVLDVISSFYLPLSSGNLLLPNVSVAEVVEFQELEEQEGPEYFLGMIRWRGISVPLISYELANEQPFEFSSSSRVAVINTIGKECERLPFFAIATQGIPRLVKIHEDSIEAASDKPGPAEASRVRVDGEEASIPDLVYLESLIAKFV
jgi:chemosensory pili system protein ChpC